jgi:hypothetical protein
MNKYINKYLQLLQEENYKVSITKKNINGEYLVNWTECYKIKCSKLKEDNLKKYCEYDCKIITAFKIISNISTEKSNCVKAKHPEKCIDSLNKLIKFYRNKINNIKKHQQKIIKK